EFLQQLLRFDEVAAAYVVTGQSNYMLQVRCRNLREFSDFVVERLNKVPGMRDICSQIVMKTLKDTRHKLPLNPP
ncbi:MAG: Lrp/AsnC ligand binding domain-containing protein, partial [Paucibacter sp.]|nr:Lrp/AsnC ligand binding domain-containing protein [Roseateles sp.]